MNNSVIPRIIFVRRALEETIQRLRERDLLTRDDTEFSLREELELAKSANLTGRAVECLLTACAAGNLRMVVVNPKAQTIHSLPSEYFDQRPIADVEFEHEELQVRLPSKSAGSDPLLKFVAQCRGWAHGFIEGELQAWFSNPDTGLHAGPWMRPFFHADQLDTTTDPAAVPVVPALKGRRGRKPGSGRKDDDAAVSKMLDLLADGRAASVFAAAGQVLTTTVPPDPAVDSARRRLSRKFSSRFGTDPPPGKTWGDVKRELNTNSPSK